MSGSSYIRYAFFLLLIFTGAAYAQKKPGNTVCNAVPRANYEAKWEPADKILSGAGQFNVQEFNNFSTSVLGAGKSPAIAMTYVGLRQSNLLNVFKRWHNDYEHYPAGVMLQVGLAMNRDGFPEEHYEHEVAAGKYDAQIDTLCMALKAWQGPVFLRIGYEFNGTWNGYDSATYKKAYVKIVDAMRRHNVTNTALVWCISYDAPADDFLNYYPGDEYVDWWSVDIFDPKYFKMTGAVKEFCDAAARRKKPLMIGESTPRKIPVTEGIKSWNEWFVPFFEFMENTPHVKAFCYINADWSTTFLPDWGDARLQKNDEVLRRFSQKMKCPLYQHGLPK